MKAMVFREYGAPEVLHLEEVATPAPVAGELLVQVRATSVNYGDLAARRFNEISPREFNMPLLFWILGRFSFGLNKPKTTILGSEFAGVVAATGDGVRRFRPGDEVFGYLAQRMGATAEYLTIAEERMVARKPANMSFEEAAVVPYGATTALNLLRKGNIQPGQKVLVVGASGNIGSAAVQLARHYGATVTGVCSTPRVELVRSLGAGHVVDYTREDFTQGGERYHLIFDVLGRRSFAQCKRALTPDGRYLLASFKMKQLLQMLWTSLGGRQKVICALAAEKREDLLEVKALIEAGAIRAAIDKSFPLEELAAAHRYAESGQKKGHLAILVGENGRQEANGPSGGAPGHAAEDSNLEDLL